MIRLLKKRTEFVWDDKCEERFRTVNGKLTIASLLMVLQVKKSYAAYMKSQKRNVEECSYKLVKLLSTLCIS